MTTVGTIESLWRYPVKSMSGERRNKIFLGFAGVYCAVVVEGSIADGDSLMLVDYRGVEKGNCHEPPAQIRKPRPFVG